MRSSNSTATTGKAVCSRSARTVSPVPEWVVATIAVAMVVVVPLVVATAEEDLVAAEEDLATVAVEAEEDTELAVVPAAGVAVVPHSIPEMPSSGPTPLLITRPQGTTSLRPSMSAT